VIQWIAVVGLMAFGCNKQEEEEEEKRFFFFFFKFLIRQKNFLELLIGFGRKNFHF